MAIKFIKYLPVTVEIFFSENFLMARRAFENNFYILINKLLIFTFIFIVIFLTATMALPQANLNCEFNYK
jgi:hypothetical protein